MFLSISHDALVAVLTLHRKCEAVRYCSHRASPLRALQTISASILICASLLAGHQMLDWKNHKPFCRATDWPAIAEEGRSSEWVSLSLQERETWHLN